MKILLIIKNFDVGGTEVNVCQLANELASRGHEVHVASNYGRQVELLNEKVTHHEFKFTEPRFIMNYLRLSTIVKKHQVMLVHGNQRMAITFAALLSRKHRIPSVATVHGQFKRDIRSKFTRRLLGKIILVAPNRLDGVKVDDELQSKVQVIYNSIPLPDRFNDKKATETVRLVCVSRIDKRHGSFLEQLILKVMPVLLEKTTNIELQIVGDGDGVERLRECLDGVSDERLTRRVKLMGYQSDPIQFMREGSVVLGVGRVAIESLSVNTPVISANAFFCGGVVTMDNYEKMKLNNFVARFAEKFSAEKVICYLNDFIENRHKIQIQHLPLSDRARDDFSSDKMMEETTLLYNKLLES